MTLALPTNNAPVRRFGALCAVLLVLAACGPESDDWRAAQSADTSVAYAHFLAQYPSSIHAPEARQRAAALVEEEAWKQTTHEDTLQAYQQHLLRFPQGKWAAEARQRIDSFVTAGRVTPAVTAPAPAPVAVLDPPVATPSPASAPAPATLLAPAPVANVAPAPAPAPASGPASAPGHLAAPPPPAAVVQRGYGAQLGAFSTAEKAESAWQALRGRFASDLGSAVHQVVAGKAGATTVYRLQVPQTSQKAARALCAQIASRGAPCVVYHP